MPLAQDGIRHGDLSKILVRFDLTLDGTLEVVATQTATGLSKALRIDNALSHRNDGLFDWEHLYERVFSDTFSVRAVDLGVSWCDPDTTYEEDVLAFRNGLAAHIEKARSIDAAMAATSSVSRTWARCTWTMTRSRKH